jgi:hypothetical protein
MNDANNTASDSDLFISMLELDLPAPPPVTARQAIPVITDAPEVPAAVRALAEVDAPLAAELGAIVAEGAANAAVVDMVRGGVSRADVNPVAGFNSPAAYAAAVPVTQASATTFAGRAVAAATVAPVAGPVVTVPTGAGTSAGITHIPTGPSVFDQPRAARMAPAAPKAEVAPAALSGTTMVAGAAAEGNAVLVGWTGKGDMTRAALAARLEAASLPVTLLPVIRSAHAQAGRAIRDACGTKYHHKAMTGRPENGVAGWTIGQVQGGAAVGEAYGRTVAAVVLQADGQLVITSDTDNAHLVTDIQTDYANRIATELYQSADVTAWLRSVITTVAGGVKLGGIYYVPRAGAATAEALCASMSKAWGEGWIDPALPVATTDQLKRGIVRGLQAEATEILHDLDAQRTVAKEQHAAGARRSEDIGPRAAGTVLANLRKVAERCVAYGALLGAEYVAELRASVLAAIATVEPLLDDTSQRGWMIWEEIEREVVAAERAADVG